jgi:hypothetical protein
MKVKLDTVLGQNPIVPTLFARALHNTMTTSKSYIQKVLDDPNPFGRVFTPQKVTQ